MTDASAKHLINIVFDIIIITRHLLVRPKGEVFVLLLLFCSFFLSTISRQPAGQFTPNFACGRTLVPNVSSPLCDRAKDVTTSSVT